MTDLPSDYSNTPLLVRHKTDFSARTTEVFHHMQPRGLSSNRLVPDKSHTTGSAFEYNLREGTNHIYTIRWTSKFIRGLAFANRQNKHYTISIISTTWLIIQAAFMTGTFRQDWSNKSLPSSICQCRGCLNIGSINLIQIVWITNSLLDTVSNYQLLSCDVLWVQFRIVTLT